MTPTETTGNRMQWYNVLSSAINSVDPLLDVQMLWTFSTACVVPKKNNSEFRNRAKKQQWKMETFARAAQEYCASKKRSLPVTGLCNMGSQPILIPQTSGW